MTLGWLECKKFFNREGKMRIALLAITLIASFTTAKINNINDIKNKFLQIHSEKNRYKTS